MAETERVGVVRESVRISEGYGASGSRGECSSERVSSRGNRAYQVQHGGVPDTRVPENGTEIKTIEVP